MACKAIIHVTLKPGVLDPQGKAIHNVLESLGFPEISEVRQGKYLELEIEETDPAQAHVKVDQMCKQLLANTVIENYKIEIEV